MGYVPLEFKPIDGLTKDEQLMHIEAMQRRYALATADYRIVSRGVAVIIVLAGLALLAIWVWA